MNQHQRDVIDYLEEENRVLREQLGNKRLRLNDDQRRRLAGKAKKLGRRVLQELKTLVTPETLWPGTVSLSPGNMMAASGGALDILARRMTSTGWWSLAKIKYAFEMTTKRRDHVTCYIDEFQTLSEFWRWILRVGGVPTFDGKWAEVE